MSAPTDRPALPARRDDIDIMTLGEILVRSRFFKDATDHAQAVVKVLAGRELGLGPIASMTGIHVVEGKPTLGANLYASFIRRHAEYDYRVVEVSRSACKIEFRRGKNKDAEVLGCYGMTIAEAHQSGLTQGKSGTKHNWKNHPDAMLFARCISQGARFYCPDIFNGVTAYTADELSGRREGPVEDVIDAQAERVDTVTGEVLASAPAKPTTKPGPKPAEPKADPATVAEATSLIADIRRGAELLPPGEGQVRLARDVTGAGSDVAKLGAILAAVRQAVTEMDVAQDEAGEVAT